jgi:hypothetical protein
MSHEPKLQDATSPPERPALDDSRHSPKYNFSALEEALLKVAKRVADRYVHEERRADFVTKSREGTAGEPVGLSE